MSKRCCPSYQKPMFGFGGFGSGNCTCSLPTLIILILIVLQFGKKDKGHDYDDYKEDGIVDNGILFIIALFYLSCVGCPRGTAY
jgi:hypothetical protein